MLDEIKIKEEITEIRSKMDAIKNNIISEKRAMTDGEQEELDALRKQINEKNEEIKALREKIDEEGKKMEKEEKKQECDDDKDDKEMKSCGEDTKKEENKRNKNINVNKMNKLQYRFKQAVENREYNRDIKLDKRSITVTGVEGMHDALIQEDFTEILEPLYANSILTKLGIQTRRGQVNDVHVPKISKGTCGFLGEIEPAQATGFEFNYITLRPKRIAAYYDISEQALIQDAIGTFNACQTNLVRKVEEYIEQEIFSDTASSDVRPAGIFNGVETKIITNYKDLCNFEADVEEKNVVGNMKYALSPRADIGSVRETFFMNQLSQSHELSYPKAGDFLVDGRYLFEVGGKGKTFTQIKDIPDSYLAVDDTEIGRGARIPLWLFGMLY